MKKAVVIPAHIFERFKNTSEHGNIDKQNLYINENKLEESYDTPDNIEKTINKINNSGIGLDRKNFLYQQFLFKILRLVRENNLDIKLPILEYKDPTTSVITTSPVLPPVTTPPATPIVTNVAPRILNDRMLQSLPKIQKVKGMQIYRIIATIPEISWDDNGVISVNGTTIPQSDIVEIVLSLMPGGKKKKTSPIGLKQLQPYINAMKMTTNVIRSQSRGRVSVYSPVQTRKTRAKKRRSSSTWKTY